MSVTSMARYDDLESLSHTVNTRYTVTSPHLSDDVLVGHHTRKGNTQQEDKANLPISIS